MWLLEPMLAETRNTLSAKVFRAYPHRRCADTRSWSLISVAKHHVSACLAAITDVRLRGTRSARRLAVAQETMSVVLRTFDGNAGRTTAAVMRERANLTMKARRRSEETSKFAFGRFEEKS